jgi:hypothetical protein
MHICNLILFILTQLALCERLTETLQGNELRIGYDKKSIYWHL